MKFRADRDTLLETLATAGRATAARSGITSGIVGLQLLLKGDALEVCGSDPDLVIEARCEVKGDTDGSVLVPTRLVVDIVRSFDSGAVTVVAGEDEVRFSSGRAEFSVRVALGAEITRLGAPDQEGIALPGHVFAEGLHQVVRAALTDDTRAPQLTGVLMVATEQGLRLIATDSYRLAFRDFTGLSALEEGRQVLVPAKALNEVQRLASGAKDAESTIMFRYGELDAVFDLADVRITTRLLRGQFPDVERLVPKTYDYQLKVNREELEAALRRVRLVVRDAKDATTPVRLALRDGGVELTVLTPESGRAVESVEGEFEGEELTVAFNPSYLLEGVEVVRGETVVLEVNDPGRPALVHGGTDTDFRYLLMPVKVS